MNLTLPFQPGGTTLLCSAPLTGSALAAMQASGGYVDAFGYPVQAAGFTSFVSCPPSSATGPSGASSTLPYGPGGNPITLTYYGQIIDVVRLSNSFRAHDLL
jgi:hypothetical protein